MEWVRLALDKFLSWPAVALIAILMFKDAISALLRRPLTVSKSGVTFAAEAVAVQVADVGPEREGSIRVATPADVDVPPIVREQEHEIRASLEQAARLPSDQIPLLIKVLALSQLNLRWEFTYRTIFGSQIAALKSLNTSGRATRAQLAPFYDAAKANDPEPYRAYSFEQWLHYLVEVLRVVTTSGPDEYTITPAGAAFLRWMTDARVFETKPL